MSLQVHEVAKRFGDQDIFTRISFNIAVGEKVALLGRNGSGKSTLLRLLAGLEPPTSGSVYASGSVALLEQRANLHGTVLDAVTPAALHAAERELRDAEQALGEPTPERLERYAQVEAHYGFSGGYDFETKAASVLAGLGLDADAATAKLSGGEQRRVMLAALLLNPADILLLDEPTNHLDARSLSWLEDWLRGLEATVIVVSHDRAFLDAVVSRVLLLARGSVLDLPGTYTEAMALRTQQEGAQWRRFEAQARKKRALTAEMHGLRAEGVRAGRFKRNRMKDNDKVKYKFWAQEASRSFAKRASALETRLERLDVVEKPFVETLTVQIPLPEVPPGPLKVLRTEALTVVRNGRTLVSKLDMQLRRGERWALLGDNGSGKSSLLAALRGALPCEGRVVLGEGSSLYWAGQHGEELETFMTLEEALREAQPALKRQDLYHLLAQLGLPADPDFPLADLSGGQRTRLTLARLSVTRATLLMLDEPTNHLDVEAITALEALLTHYPGTLLFTSHDRRFVQTVATHTLNVGSAEPSAGAMIDTVKDDA